MCEPHLAKMRDEKCVAYTDVVETRASSEPIEFAARLKALQHRQQRWVSFAALVALGLLWSAAATSKLVPIASAEISSASMR